MSRTYIPTYAGALSLTVLSANGLAAKEGKADPYVSIYVVSPSDAHHPEEQGKTRVIKRDTEPSWDQSFDFNFGSATSRDDRLRLEVWDYNSIMRDKFMGQAELSLVPGDKLEEGVEIEVELPLGQREGKSKETVSGTIKIKAKLASDYHRQRAERDEAEAKKAQEDKEKEEKLIEQVRLSHSSAEALIAAFKRRASSSSGGINRYDFSTVYDSLDSASRAAIAKHVAGSDALFECLDLNHDGSLDLEEVLFGLSTLATGSLDDKAELVFKAMDLDNSGFLDKEEVKKQSEKLFKAFCAFTKQAVNDIIYKKYHRTFPDYQLQPIMDSLSAPLKEKLTVDGVFTIFQRGDTDNDGQLSLDEWRALVKSDEFAQWLVSPETYVAKVKAEVGPKLEALARRM